MALKNYDYKMYQDHHLEPGHCRPVGDGKDFTLDKDIDWHAWLDPILAEHPRLFSGNISKLVDHIEMECYAPLTGKEKLDDDDDEDEEEFEFDETIVDLARDYPFMHTKVLQLQDIHLGPIIPNELLPDDMKEASPLPPRRPAEFLVAPPPPPPVQALLPGRGRMAMRRPPPARPVEQQPIIVHVWHPDHLKEMQQRRPLGERQAPAPAVRQGSVEVNENSNSDTDSSGSFSGYSSDESEFDLYEELQLDGVPMVCLGSGRDALCCTFVDALNHKRKDPEGNFVLDSMCGVNANGEHVSKHVDPFERNMGILNRICVWLFFCTHHALCDDADLAHPKDMNDIEDKEEEVIHISDFSVEPEGLIYEPNEPELDSEGQITIREAKALWVYYAGVNRSHDLPRKATPESPNEEKTQEFVLKFVMAAGMRLSNAITTIADGASKAVRGEIYRPSAEVLQMAVPIEFTQHFNTFIQYHMASDAEFRRACATSYAQLAVAMLPAALLCSLNITEGREVKIGELIGNFTHSVVTNQVSLKRHLEMPPVHLSQKKRREAKKRTTEETMRLFTSGTSPLRDQSDEEPSAFQPVFRGRKEIKKELDE